MLFSVIYSFDVPRDVSVGQYNPPKSQRKLWQMTEGDEQYEYGYLEGCWTKGKHRKHCALLTREQFDEFVSHTGLFAEDVQTMGSIGAPGLGFGCAPAISFRNDDPDAIQNAYVTPLPCAYKPDDLDREFKHIKMDEERWEKVRRAVINTY